LQAIAFLDENINKTKATDPKDKTTLAENLAETLDTLNYFHPFREGNGRSQRLAMRLLAREKGYDIDLNPPNSLVVYEQYMKGTIDGNVKLLTELFDICLEPWTKPMKTNANPKSDETQKEPEDIVTSAITTVLKEGKMEISEQSTEESLKTKKQAQDSTDSSEIKYIVPNIYVAL